MTRNRAEMFKEGDKESEGNKCLWSTCTAKLSSNDDIIPHLSTTHLSKSKTAASPQSSSSNNFVHACKWALCTLSNFFSIDDLIKHLYSDHLNSSSSNKNLPHACNWNFEDTFCNERFETFDDLTFHLNSHVGNGKKSYICYWNQCKRKLEPLKTRQAIMRHLQTHTGDKPYTCSVCYAKFSETGTKYIFFYCFSS